MAMKSWSLAGLIGFLAVAVMVGSFAAAQTTRSGGPVMTGRDTPAGAMNVFERAIADADTATVADSFNLPADTDGSCRQALANQLLAVRRLASAAEARFGHDAAVSIFRQCRMPWPRQARESTAADWTMMPGETNYARATNLLDPWVRQSRVMTRGPDGIWRMGTGTPDDPEMLQVVADRENASSLRLDQIAAAITAKKYATADDVIHAFWPGGTPVERQAALQKQRQPSLLDDLTAPMQDVAGAIAWGLIGIKESMDQSQNQTWTPSVPTAKTISEAQPIGINGPATTRPVLAGRNSPAGAMRVYEEALNKRDVATVADSFSIPAGPYRRAMVLRAIAERHFYLTARSWFGQDAAAYVCFECSVPRPQTGITDADWRPVWGNSKLMGGKIIGHERGVLGVERPSFLRGPDGIWRMDVARGSISVTFEGSSDDAISTAAHLNKFSAAVAAGNFAHPGDLVRAVQLPEGATTRKASQNERPWMIARNPNTATLEGAYFGFIRGIANKDSDGLAKLFFAEGDTKGELARANAERIVSANRLDEAIDAKLGPYGDALVAGFGLLTKMDHPEWSYALSENGDRAMGMFADGFGIQYREVAGLWRVDITPPAPQTDAQECMEMQHDNQAVEQITADIMAGKYKTAADVRDALLGARLWATPDPSFAANGFALPGKNGNRR
jgi:hypothetical protein